MASVLTWSFLVLTIAFAKPQGHDSSQVLANSQSDIDLPSDAEAGASFDYFFRNVPPTTDTTFPGLQSPTSSTFGYDDLQAIDVSKAAPFDLDEVGNVRNPSNAPVASHIVAQLGDSLFNPIDWLAKGVEFTWSTDAKLLNAVGDVLVSGVISLKEITVYFSARHIRKVNGVEVTDDVLQNMIEQIKCPESEAGNPLEVFCRQRITGGQRKHSIVGNYANQIDNVVPMLIDGVFNALILRFKYISCYCCQSAVESKRLTGGLDGKQCTLMFVSNVEQRL